MAGVDVCVIAACLCCKDVVFKYGPCPDTLNTGQLLGSMQGCTSSTPCEQAHAGHVSSLCTFTSCLPTVISSSGRHELAITPEVAEVYPSSPLLRHGFLRIKAPQAASGSSSLPVHTSPHELHSTGQWRCRAKRRACCTPHQKLLQGCLLSGDRCPLYGEAPVPGTQNFFAWLLSSSSQHLQLCRSSAALAVPPHAVQFHRAARSLTDWPPRPGTGHVQLWLTWDYQP